MHTWPQPCRVVQSPNLPRCQDPGLLSQITLRFAGFVTVLTNTWDFELENLRSSNFRKIAVKKLRLRWGWRGKFPHYHLTVLLIRVFGEPSFPNSGLFGISKLQSFIFPVSLGIGQELQVTACITVIAYGGNFREEKTWWLRTVPMIPASQR